MSITLDNEQRAAVYAEDKNVLVVAGAGSGKTRVLTERIKHLVESGVEPSGIVAITFTNMAADEMRARLKDVATLGDAFIGTIHSFANRIYKSSGETFMLETEEQSQLIMEEICNMPKYGGALTIKRYLQFLDLRKQADAGRIDEDVPMNTLNPSERNVLYKCKGDYEAIKKRDHIISFDELLVYAKKYYEGLGATIEHVLVDELQDIGTAEYEFIRALNAEHYFFVGDDYQAIYGFKGGNVEIFKALTKDPLFKTYFLQNNYRNCKQIIELGSRIIHQVPDRIPKKAIAMHEGVGTWRVQRKDNKEYLVNILRNDKANWRDWFVLTRTNREAYQLADLLDDEGINYCFLRRSDMTLDELEEALKTNLVKIMTVHSSKGLENKKVILYGNFPLNMPSWYRNTDERKVMYVGVTRAIDRLYIFN